MIKGVKGVPFGYVYCCLINTDLYWGGITSLGSALLLPDPPEDKEKTNKKRSNTLLMCPVGFSGRLTSIPYDYQKRKKKKTEQKEKNTDEKKKKK